MTAPAPTSVPFDVGPGTGVRLTDGTGNSPAGCQLINPGLNGGTVWLSAGPTGAGLLPLGPGAAITWADPAVLPYARLAPGATRAERVVVTSQSAAYSNPAAVAAVTAAQLAAQGIPSTFLDTEYGSLLLGASISSAALLVGQSSTLIVSVVWPQPAPLGATVLRLDFADPAVPALPVQSFYLTNSNVVDNSENTWQVPVVAPQLVITNQQSPDNNNAPASVFVAGNNRPASKFRMIGGEGGTWHGAPTAPVTAGVFYSVTATNDSGAAAISRQTRLTGPCTLFTEGSGAGTLIPAWVDQTGRNAHCSIPTNGTPQTSTFYHPAVPVFWRWVPAASGAGNTFSMTLLGGT